MDDLRIKSVEYRKKLLKYIKLAGAGHTGGSLSCIDILNVLYNNILNISPELPDKPDRDRYIQSKGHSVEALYVVLADLGFFPEHDLETLCRYGSHYVGHPTRKVKGIEHNTGALGHGLSVSTGIAMAAKMDGNKYKVYTLVGDGELTEGSNWEAALTASHYKLDNLTAIVDYNHLQITGLTMEVCNTDPLEDKFLAFGWHVENISGHDLEEMNRFFREVPLSVGKPTCIIAHTVKGKGVSYMENKKRWHHGVPDDEQFNMAMEELDSSLKFPE
ncbi:MAG: transketolase [Cyclobacteriaceae bacterium]|nr:transketolase [Cyclobacteriaceae bacterium]